MIANFVSTAANAFRRFSGLVTLYISVMNTVLFGSIK